MVSSKFVFWGNLATNREVRATPVACQKTDAEIAFPLLSQTFKFKRNRYLTLLSPLNNLKEADEKGE